MTLLPIFGRFLVSRETIEELEAKNAALRSRLDELEARTVVVSNVDAVLEMRHEREIKELLERSQRLERELASERRTNEVLRLILATRNMAYQGARGQD